MLTCGCIFCSPDAVYAVAEAVSLELRALNNGEKAAKQYLTGLGLNCFSPVVNIMRHPLWGRNQVRIL